jgi:hypothetical protein
MNDSIYHDLVFDDCVILSADGVVLSHLETVEEGSEVSSDEAQIDAEDVCYAARSPAGRRQRTKVELQKELPDSAEMDKGFGTTGGQGGLENGAAVKVDSNFDTGQEELITTAIFQEQNCANMTLLNGDICNWCRGLYGNKGCEQCCESTTFCEEPESDMSMKIKPDYKWGELLIQFDVNICGQSRPMGHLRSIYQLRSCSGE